MMKSLGQQMAVELYNCDPEVLNNEGALREIMCEAALAAGCTIVKEVFHSYNPHGVSGVVILAESHLAVHTWPEYNYAAVDLFTCGAEVHPERCFQHLKEQLKATHSTVVELKRGVLDVPGNLCHKPTAVSAISLVSDDTSAVSDTTRQR